MGESQLVRNEPSRWIANLPSVDATSNKYTKGHALIFGGYPMTGAARLAARACARMGAGLTTIAVEPQALDVYANISKHHGALDCRHRRSETVLADERISAVLIGPGLGVGDRTRNLVEAVLDASRPTVLDADALTSFAEDPSKLSSDSLLNACSPRTKESLRDSSQRRVRDWTEQLLPRNSRGRSSSSKVPRH